jgi:hypothetical protein
MELTTPKDAHVTRGTRIVTQSAIGKTTVDGIPCFVRLRQPIGFPACFNVLLDKLDQRIVVASSRENPASSLRRLVQNKLLYIPYV